MSSGLPTIFVLARMAKRLAGDIEALSVSRADRIRSGIVQPTKGAAGILRRADSEAAQHNLLAAVYLRIALPTPWSPSHVVIPPGTRTMAGSRLGIPTPSKAAYARVESMMTRELGPDVYNVVRLMDNTVNDLDFALRNGYRLVAGAAGTSFTTHSNGTFGRLIGIAGRDLSSPMDAARATCTQASRAVHLLTKPHDPLPGPTEEIVDYMRRRVAHVSNAEAEAQYSVLAANAIAVERSLGEAVVLPRTWGGLGQIDPHVDEFMRYLENPTPESLVALKDKLGQTWLDLDYTSGVSNYRQVTDDAVATWMKHRR